MVNSTEIVRPIKCQTVVARLIEELTGVRFTSSTIFNDGFDLIKKIFFVEK